MLTFIHTKQKQCYLENLWETALTEKPDNVPPQSDTEDECVYNKIVFFSNYYFSDICNLFAILLN